MTEHIEDPAIRAAVLRDEQRRMRVDPAIAHNVARIEAQERLEEAESARRAAEEEHARGEEARARLAARKDRERELAMSAGFSVEDFERQWPEQVARIMREEQAARERLQRQSSVF